MRRKDRFSGVFRVWQRSQRQSVQGSVHHQQPAPRAQLGHRLTQQELCGGEQRPPSLNALRRNARCRKHVERRTSRRFDVLLRGKPVDPEAASRDDPQIARVFPEIEFEKDRVRTDPALDLPEGQGSAPEARVCSKPFLPPQAEHGLANFPLGPFDGGTRRLGRTEGMEALFGLIERFRGRRAVSARLSIGRRAAGGQKVQQAPRPRTFRDLKGLDEQGPIAGPAVEAPSSDPQPDRNRIAGSRKRTF